MSAQLPLQIGLRPPATLEGFVAGDNAQALASVHACALGTGEPLLFLAGPPGSGRTHLLAGACNLAATAGLRCAYLPMGDPAGLAPGLLSDLEALDLVCLDDLEGIAGDRGWEEAVFGLFNGLRDHGGRLIAAAEGAQLVVLPEMFNVGFTFGEELMTVAEELDGRTIDWLRAQAARHGIYITGSLYERFAGHFYNTMFMVGRRVFASGRDGARKMTCFPSSLRKRGISP